MAKIKEKYVVGFADCSLIENESQGKHITNKPYSLRKAQERLKVYHASMRAGCKPKVVIFKLVPVI